MASSTGRFPISFFVAWQWKRSIRHFCSHTREPLTWHMQGRILTEKSGTAEPSMFQSVSVKLRISLSCLRFFFQPEKNQDELLFWRDRRRTVLQRRLLRRWWGLVPSFYQKWRMYRRLLCSVMQCSRLFADRYRVFVVPRSLTDTEEI